MDINVNLRTVDSVMIIIYYNYEQIIMKKIVDIVS